MSLRAILQWLWPHEDEAYALMHEVSGDLLGGAEEILASIQAGGRREFEHLRGHMMDRKRRVGDLQKRLTERLGHPFMPVLEGETAVRITRALRELQENLDGIVDLLSIYGVPREAGAVQGLARNMTEAMRVMAFMIKSLPKKRLAEILKEQMEALRRIEAEADTQFKEALGRLYGMPPDPIELMETQDLLRRLAETVDHIQQVAKSVQDAVVFE